MFIQLGLWIDIHFGTSLTNTPKIIHIIDGFRTEIKLIQGSILNRIAKPSRRSTVKVNTKYYFKLCIYNKGTNPDYLTKNGEELVQTLYLGRLLSPSKETYNLDNFIFGANNTFCNHLWIYENKAYNAEITLTTKDEEIEQTNPLKHDDFRLIVQSVDIPALPAKSLGLNRRV